MHASVVIFRCR